MSLMDKIGGVFKKNQAGPVEVKIDKKQLLNAIKQSELFESLDSDNLEQLYSKMETLAIKANEDIISEGDEGDYYYLLVSGTAKVTRMNNGQQELLANITEPKGFGEDALISNAKRNATITMTSNGNLMRLSKDDFNEYIKDPLISWLSPVVAQEKVTAGAVWVDVRDSSETSDSTLRGAKLIPFDQLRAQMAELDKEAEYICYCDNGRQSSSAAFVMSQKGYKASVLRGGLRSFNR